MPRAGLGRAAVVDLALAVVDDGGPTGFTDLTLAAVAGRAGVAVPSLYKHVAGLPGLRREVARTSIEGFTTSLVAARGSLDGPDALRAMADATRAYAKAYPGRYQCVQGSSWARDPDAAAVQTAAARTVDLLAGAIAALGVAPERRIDAVRAFRAAVHGFVVLELDGGFGMPDDVDVSFAFLVDGLVGGLERLAVR
ncbi:TetR/AcrR family transcriptional regulator [Cellulomonas fengjieae]|uniref:TetR/AcrR family transcriptional regulator n=1 Tax=Cellulomonas fengjieae TaxID=2819978 RepID=UPI001AAF2BB9|nr:TetR-like C-terminal domain-containing protein [Cellulomonas fengjieae]MBO3100509.1 WHG domain-containing protein [Cellulomonas fengjieae]